MLLCWGISLYPHFVEIFYYKCMLNFVKSFFCFDWDDHTAFILQLVNVVYLIDWFVDIEPSLHPLDKSHLIIVYNIYFSNILLKENCYPLKSTDNSKINPYVAIIQSQEWPVHGNLLKSILHQLLLYYFETKLINYIISSINIIVHNIICVISFKPFENLNRIHRIFQKYKRAFK